MLFKKIDNLFNKLRNPAYKLLSNKYAFIVYYSSVFIIGTIHFLMNLCDIIIEAFPKTINPNIYYFDFETTGLNPFHDKIIDYAFIRESKDDLITINSLVNPNVKFEKKITDITNIHPDQLENLDTIDKHTDNILKFICSAPKTKFQINKYYFVAHNCDGFDKFFLKRMYNDEKYKTKKINDWVFIDTLLLAKKLLPDNKSYSLANLSRQFKIVSGNHRALSDTVCLQHLYHKLIEIMAVTIKRSKEDLMINPQLVYDYIYE